MCYNTIVLLLDFEEREEDVVRKQSISYRFAVWEE